MSLNIYGKLLLFVADRSLAETFNTLTDWPDARISGLSMTGKLIRESVSRENERRWKRGALNSLKFLWTRSLKGF